MDYDGDAGLSLLIHSIIHQLIFLKLSAPWNRMKIIGYTEHKFGLSGEEKEVQCILLFNLLYHNEKVK